ncbi:MAG: MarR family transcriptional regulator [Deltaproteobacteria bacterium]|nr:MarR family transcriptional regulator [Deltaproteobacteria bacterium]
MIKKSGETVLDALHSILPLLHIHVFPIIHNLYWRDIRLKENQIKVIMAVHYLNQTTSTELSKGLNIPKGSLTTIIRSLVELKIIQKETPADDERVSWLKLTRRGKECLRYKKRQDIEKLNELFDQMSDDTATNIAKNIELLSAYLRTRS